MSSFDTPQAIIGLELDGKGFDQVNAQLNQQAQGWERIEQSVGRMAGHMNMISRSAATLAAGIGAASVIADIFKLEDAASRAALTSGVVGGPGTYGPFRNALRGAGVATSIDARDIASAVQGIVGTVGTGGMTTPGAWGGLGTDLGHFSRAFGIDIGQLGAQTQALELFQKLRGPDAGVVLGGIAAQAGAMGQSGQVAQWLSAIGAATGAVGAAHPMMTGPGTSQSLGALYGAVSAGNPVFQDPGMFTAGVMGIDGALSGAYRNPRMQAALQMAGVGYWQQRGGLAGKGGADMAQKLLRYSERQYGKGTVEQDIFLRSQFGDVSADMLHAFAAGEITYDDLKRAAPGERGAGTEEIWGGKGGIIDRSQANQDTPGARLNRLQQDAGDAVDGPLAGVLDTLGIDSFEEAVALLGGAAIGKKLLGKGGRALFNKLKTRGGRAAAERAAAGGAAAAGARGGAALGWGSKALKFGGPAAAVTGFLLDPGDLANEDQYTLKRWTRSLEGQFGADWASNQQAREWAVKQFGLHSRPQDGVMRALGHAFDLGGTQKTTGAAAAGDLSSAAGKLSKAAEELYKAAREKGGASNHGASYDPQGLGGHPASQMGSSMIMARYLSDGGGASAGGGGGLAETQLVAMGIGGSGGGGGGSSAGGAWKQCELTYYRPSLGGINADSNPGDYADGSDVDEDHDLVCAAPSGFAFGTRIEFKYRGKTVTCTVRDRGGAISGSRFDLIWHAAQVLGMVSAGRVRAHYRVVGSKPRSTRSSAGGGGSRATAASASGGSASQTFLAGTGAAARAASARLGGGGGVQVHVNVDGREIERTKRLVRG